MGQYYYVANLNKCQYLHPHQLGDGLKLLEFGASSEGTMAALALLLADNPKEGLVGSWCGDRIAIVGDYGPNDGAAYQVCSEKWENISLQIREILKEHGLKPRARWDIFQRELRASLRKGE